MTERIGIIMPSVVDLGSIGASTIARVTGQLLDAVADQAKLETIIAQLVMLANQPRDESMTPEELSEDTFALVVAAYAALAAADAYPPDCTEQQRLTVVWFRDTARALLARAADNWSINAVQSAKPEARTMQ